MEDILEKVQTKEHKGNYGNTKGKSANAIYKSYKTFVEDKGNTPMSFPEWLKWAKEKGIVPKNLSAEGDSLIDPSKKDDATLPVNSNLKKYASVVICGVIVLVLYKAWKSEDNK